MVITTKEELEQIIKAAVSEAISLITAPQVKPSDELLTRFQVCEILSLSLSTLNNLTKAGKIKGSRIGRRVLYKRSDVDAALITIQASNLKDN